MDDDNSSNNNKNGDSETGQEDFATTLEFVTVNKNEVEVDAAEAIAFQEPQQEEEKEEKKDQQPTVPSHVTVAEEAQIPDAEIHCTEQNPNPERDMAKDFPAIAADRAIASSETPDNAENVAVPVESAVSCEACEDTDASFHEAHGHFQVSPNELPDELRNKLVILQCESTAPGGVCDVYLVGTAHVSQESCREVESAIRFLKPQVVFLELCSSRVGMLAPQVLEVPSFSEMIDMWRNKKMNGFGVLYSWFLAKVADKLEVFPGTEFRIAYEEAMSYGAKVILGDRPVQITLRRTWATMSLWYKAKFLFSTVFQAMLLPSAEELNKMMTELGDVDMLTLVIQEMSKKFPSLIETLVHERDLYMSSTLLKVASEHNSVVGVVGKGHLAGIKKNWKQPVSVSSLLEVPVVKSSSGKLWTAVALAFGGVAIFSGLYLMGKK
uniref:TraB family protein n=1 Tax=Araucaria cunninghamii TaxID=56994 RepID=A0A0D6QV94_ARACU